MKALIEKKMLYLMRQTLLSIKQRQRTGRLRIANLIAIMKSKQSLQGSIRLFQP